MAHKKDPLESEISASVSVTDTGVEAKLKSRSTSAFDRLFGNVFDYFGLKIERPNSRERAAMDVERAVIEAAGKSVISRIEVDPEYATRMIENHLKGISRKQRNKEAIGKIAFEEMKRLPLPDEVSMKGAPENVDEDWLNKFEGIAETASTERMQQLFGKILSGEIRKPGAFSLATLRVASELNQRTAQLFQNLVGVRIANSIVEFDDSEDVSDFLDLEAAGLINFDGGELGDATVSSDNKTVAVVGGEIWAIFEIKEPTKELMYPTIRLTAAGHELAALIPNDELRAFKVAIANCKDRIIKAELFKIIGQQGENVQCEEKPFETIELRGK